MSDIGSWRVRSATAAQVARDITVSAHVVRLLLHLALQSTPY